MRHASGMKLIELPSGTVKAADARVHWGGDWPGFKDRPHFEV